MTMTMTKAMAAAIALTLAGAPAAGAAGDAITPPCQQTQDSPAAKPSAAVGAVTGAGGLAPQITAPRTGTAPRKLAPALPPSTRTGATKPAYALEQDTAAIIFGDGQYGQRLPSGGGNTTATYRTGAGAAGKSAATPCK